MSLIQDALKRKREEHDAPLSILPDPEQVAQQLEEQVQRIKQQAIQEIIGEQQRSRVTPRKKRNLALGVLCLLGIAGVIVGSMLAGGFLITRNPEVTTWNQKLQVATERNTAEAPAPDASHNPDAATTTAVNKENDEAKSASANPASPLESSPAVQQQNLPPVASTTKQGWPDLTIVGVMARANSGRSSAVINNRVVFVNQRIQGVRLIEVQDTGVVLEYKGEQRQVEVGQQPGDHVD